MRKFRERSTGFPQRRVGGAAWGDSTHGTSNEIGRLAIGDSIPPAAVVNANPFEGDGADGCMVALAFGALQIVMLSSPNADADGASCPLVKGLPDELGAGPSPVDPGRFTAGLLDRGNAGETGEAVS